MRVPTFIFSLALTGIMFLQSCAVYTLGSLSDSLQEGEEISKITGGGAVGILASLLCLIGMALVLTKAKAAMWSFIAAAVFALLAGTSGFTDMYIWGVLLAVLVFFSFRMTGEQVAQPLVTKQDNLLGPHHNML